MDEQFSAEYITFRDTLGYVKLAIFFSGIRVAFFSDHRAHLSLESGGIKQLQKRAHQIWG